MSVLFRHCLLWLLLLSALPAQAQRSHAPLATSDSLDFSTLLEHSLQRAPALLEDPVRRQEAEDWLAAGHSWLSGRPSINLNYFDDSILDDRGQRELEYGIQLPLWRPGERDSARALGQRYEEQVPLWLQALGLELAGQLRTVLADIAEAESLLQLERDATANAQELVGTTRVLYENGQVPRLELLQAQNLLLAQQQHEFAAEAALVDAEIAYRELTGLDQRPVRLPAESRHAAETIAEVEGSHPLLRYLHGEVLLAQAGVEQSAQSARGSPQLGLGARRERGDRFTPFTDSINLSLQIPIGGRSWVDSRTSAARRTQVEAEVRWLQAQRELDRALHEAEHELDVAERSLPLAQEQARLASERLAMAEVAFAEGEIDMSRLLPAVQEARSAEQSLQLLELRLQRLVTDYNQILGVLP